VRGETTGILYFNSLVSDFFQPAQFSLFQSIADQIAVAVANILANEEIAERERQKSLLLSISGDIAGARNAVELLQVIRKKRSN
jgi:GAF domain-containing protein